MEDESTAWVVFRGTEFDSLNDWITNLDCRFRSSLWGPVHKGFRDDVESIAFELGAHLIDATMDNKQIIITGHSQGAADAEQYMMQRCAIFPEGKHKCIAIAPPRSMSEQTAIDFGSKNGHNIYHIINNNDVVTRVPPRFMEYHHTHMKNLRYLDEDGQVHSNISWWEKFKDRIKGRLYDFGELGTDGVKDHSITEYQRIWKALL